MGQISAKFIKRLGRSRKLTGELRREAGSIRAALDVLKQGATARSRLGETLDPLHGVYVAVQNLSSVFAERVSVLPEFDPYYRVALDAEETYMPGGPPMSPLPGSYFTAWAFYDLRFGPDDHALRGYWDRFPVSPEPFAREIGSHFRSKNFYSERASFGLSRTLDRYVAQAEALQKSGESAEAQALLRGWMTAVVELMGHADDSCGSIGMSFGDGFGAYLKIPLDRTGIAEDVFFPDLLDFLIWEDYGLTDDRIEGDFKGLTPAQADLCIGHLRQRIEELRADELEYQSEEALTLLGKVVAEQERFDIFEDLAREMGAREWQRIIRLADRAMKKRKKPLALKVFEAATTEGWHLDFLARKYEKLKEGEWSPDPRK